MVLGTAGTLLGHHATRLSTCLNLPQCSALSVSLTSRPGANSPPNHSANTLSFCVFTRVPVSHKGCPRTEWAKFLWGVVAVRPSDAPSIMRKVLAYKRLQTQQSLRCFMSLSESLKHGRANLHIIWLPWHTKDNYQGHCNIVLFANKCCLKWCKFHQWMKVYW